MTNPVTIKLYRWAGSWGPFKIKIPCGECTLTEDVIEDCINNELRGIDVDFQQFEWLSKWWQPLPKGGWHAPIVLVENKLVSQGIALNRGVLTQTVIEAASDSRAVRGNLVYGKATCPHCHRAKKMLSSAEIDVDYQDVVKEPRALYEMIARIKPIIGEKTPVTVPQIWLDGRYIGGADALAEHLQVAA